VHSPLTVTDILPLAHPSPALQLGKRLSERVSRLKGCRLTIINLEKEFHFALVWPAVHYAGMLPIIST
jgi:hypothetical protein